MLWVAEDAPLDRPYAAFWIGDGVFALYRAPQSPEEMEALWGTTELGSRHHLMSLYVDNLAGAAETLDREGIRILRGSPDEGLLVTHPDDVSGITIAWTDKPVGNLAP